MKTKYLIFVALCLVSMASYSADLYVVAKIERVEICDNSDQYSIRLFLKDATGSVPPLANGCSNNGDFPYVWLLHNSSELPNKNPMLSMALTAYASGAEVTIRYGDVDNTIVSLALM